jgi:starvation-inducible outer membrane lipoprotein
MKCVLLLTALMLAGCSSTSEPFNGMGEPSYMQRQEVINAVTECESAGMRAQVVHTYVKPTLLSSRVVPVPIDVHCNVNYK